MTAMRFPFLRDNYEFDVQSELTPFQLEEAMCSLLDGSKTNKQDYVYGYQGRSNFPEFHLWPAYKSYFVNQTEAQKIRNVLPQISAKVLDRSIHIVISNNLASTLFSSAVSSLGLLGSIALIIASIVRMDFSSLWFLLFSSIFVIFPIALINEGMKLYSRDFMLDINRAIQEIKDRENRKKAVEQ